MTLEEKKALISLLVKINEYKDPLLPSESAELALCLHFLNERIAALVSKYPEIVAQEWYACKEPFTKLSLLLKTLIN